MTPPPGHWDRSSRVPSRWPASPKLAGLVLCLLALLTGSVRADGGDQPVLDLGTPQVRGNHVWLEVTISYFLTGEVLDALHSGLPATVVFEWQIWERRAAWWDRHISSGATFYRAFYDVLQNRYDVFDHRGRPIAFSDDLAEIERAISERPGLKTVTVSALMEDRRYYIEVLARIELLDDEEVGRLKEWLTGGEDDKKGFNIVESLSGRLSNALGGMIGPGKKTIVSRTDDFNGFSP